MIYNFKLPKQILPGELSILIDSFMKFIEEERYNGVLIDFSDAEIIVSNSIKILVNFIKSIKILGLEVHITSIPDYFAVTLSDAFSEFNDIIITNNKEDHLNRKREVTLDDIIQTKKEKLNILSDSYYKQISRKRIQRNKEMIRKLLLKEEEKDNFVLTSEIILKKSKKSEVISKYYEDRVKDNLIQSTMDISLSDKNKSNENENSEEGD